jgi:hypothetical protein
VDADGCDVVDPDPVAVGLPPRRGGRRMMIVTSVFKFRKTWKKTETQITTGGDAPGSANPITKSMPVAASVRTPTKINLMATE